MSQRRIYTLDEARALVPQVRAVLLQLAVQQRRADDDAGADVQALLAHLSSLDVELRDLEMGLVDFPGQREGRPIWLCWRLADPELAFWHGTNEGYTSRRPC